MEVFKCLLWCCMAVTISARIPHGTELFSSAFNSVPEEQCYCIPKSISGVKVTDMQVPQKERLVVYLYKNVYDDITVHIPNHEKQRVLPDIQIEPEDVLEENVKYYTVDDLFNTNMSHSLFPVDEIYPFRNHHRGPSGHHKYNIYVPTEPQIYEKPDSIMNPNDIPLEIVSPGNNIYLPINTDNFKVPKKGMDINLNLMDVIKKNTEPLPWISNKPINFQFSDVTGPEEIIETIPMEGLKTLHPTRLINQVINEPTNYQQFTSIFPQEIDIIPEQYLKNIPPHHKFHQWLQAQINVLMNHKSYAKYALDINTLKGLLVKTLQNNGIQISNTGFLIDSKGNQIKINNLKLNPVFLGDPREYEKRFATKGCLAPQELPHIETVLLSSSNPPRILGIIPLGNAVLSSVSNMRIPICSQSSSYKPGSPCHQMPLLSPVMKAAKKTLFNRQFLLNGLFRRKNSDDDTSTQPIQIGEMLGGDELSEFVDVVEPKKIEMRPPMEITTIEEIGTDGDYEDLGIRVLGGQSATSSGAPISNKGRSGMP